MLKNCEATFLIQHWIIISTSAALLNLPGISNDVALSFEKFKESPTYTDVQLVKKKALAGGSVHLCRQCLTSLTLCFFACSMLADDLKLSSDDEDNQRVGDTLCSQKNTITAL